MKINIITCHDVYNLGASLQAFALQKYLGNCGHEVQTIDYKPDYLSHQYDLWSVSKKYNKSIVRILYLMAKLPGRILSLKRKRIFDDFTFHYLKLTARYHSNEELKRNPPQADVYIAGSDQIWNTLFPNGKDPAFYLDFVPEGKRCISYAASFATPSISSVYVSFVTKMLARLDAVSVREKSALPLLNSLGRGDGVAVCDPVFLLSSDFWISLLSPIKSRPYVLVYDFEHSARIRQCAQFIAEQKGLDIISVGPFPEKYAKKNFVNVGPLEFINLIQHSAYFISNSFHGTAFSLIFRKNFFVVNREEGINERMKSLLKDLGLEERLVSGIQRLSLDDIEYDEPLLKLQAVIRSSKDFLKKNLE